MIWILNSIYCTGVISTRGYYLLIWREINAGTIQEHVLNETSRARVKIEFLREISAGTIQERVLFKSGY